MEFLSLQEAAGAIVTDGGVQEEAAALGVSCYTFRTDTEPPVTIARGTNVLLGEDPALIADVQALAAPPPRASSRSGTATRASAPPTPSMDLLVARSKRKPPASSGP